MLNHPMDHVIRNYTIDSEEFYNLTGKLHQNIRKYIYFNWNILSLMTHKDSFTDNVFVNINYGKKV